MSYTGQIEKSRDINTVHVQRILMDMRSYRMGLIQTAKQLRFSYQAIIEGAKHILSSSSLDAGFADITQVSGHGNYISIISFLCWFLYM